MISDGSIPNILDDEEPMDVITTYEAAQNAGFVTRLYSVNIKNRSLLASILYENGVEYRIVNDLHVNYAFYVKVGETYAGRLRETYLQQRDLRNKSIRTTDKSLQAKKIIAIFEEE